MFIVDEILSCIVSSYFNVIGDSVNENKDKKSLRKELTNYVDIKFDREIINTDLKFDYHGFLDYIKTDAVIDIRAYLCELDLKTCDSRKDSIVREAIRRSSSQGQKHSEELVQKLVSNILEIIKYFYTSKVKTGEITVLKDIVGQSTQIIIDNSDKNKDDIITSFKEAIAFIRPVQTNGKFQGSGLEHQTSNDKIKAVWVNTGTGKAIDNGELLEIGNSMVTIIDDVIMGEVEMPDGKKIYAEFDAKTGNLIRNPSPYPISEYEINIPKELILERKNVNTTIDNREYNAEIYILKFGGEAQLIYEIATNKLAFDPYIKAPAGMKVFRDDSNKCYSIKKI